MPLPAPESLGLPSKPGSSAASSSKVVLDAGRAPNCALCGQPAKYTCPRCSTRTCSLPCSKLHKARADCSGERNPAAFVPLAKYAQGTWDADYAWLEATRRQVLRWGEGVGAEEAASAPAPPGAPERGNKSGRGRGGAAMKGKRPVKRKADGLKWAIGELGAEVDVLPDGMQRRRLNQSSWYPKSHTLLMTLQLALPAALIGEDKLETHHRLAVLPTSTVTLYSLLPEALRARTDIIFALPYHVPRRLQAHAAASLRKKRYFTPLDGRVTLDRALSGTAFVEFPTIHVFAQAEWARAIGMCEIEVLPRLQLRGTKREAEPVRAVVKKPRTQGLAGLGDYGDSDDEDEETADVAEDDLVGAEEDAEEQVEDELEALGDVEEAHDDEQGDITLAPAMAQALGAALEADFGPA